MQVLDVLIALLKPRQGNERLNGQESAHQSEASEQLDLSIKQAAVQVEPRDRLHGITVICLFPTYRAVAVYYRHFVWVSICQTMNIVQDSHSLYHVCLIQLVGET